MVKIHFGTDKVKDPDTRKFDLWYTAKYIGFETPPRNPHAEIQDTTGYRALNYAGLVLQVAHDLRTCQDVIIEAIYSDNISQKQQELTDVVLSVVRERNAELSKVERAADILRPS